MLRNFYDSQKNARGGGRKRLLKFIAVFQVYQNCEIIKVSPDSDSEISNNYYCESMGLFH